MPRAWPVYAFVPASLVAGCVVGYIDAHLTDHGAFSWIALLLALIGIFAATLTVIQPREEGRMIVLESFALLPLALVVKDFTTLTLQGSSPWTTDWYQNVLGDNLLGGRYFGLPGWYVLAALWTATMAVIPAKTWAGRTEALAALKKPRVTRRPAARGRSSSAP